MDSAPARPRRSWGVFLATWLALSALTSAQVVLNAAAVGSPLDWSFAAVRLVEAAMVVVYVPALLALDRLAPAERVGVPHHLAVTLAALAPLCAAATVAALRLADFAVRVTTDGGILFKG